MIFLDLPPATCLWGSCNAAGATAARWPRVRALIAEHAGHAHVHIVTSRRAGNRLIKQLQHAVACR